MNVVKLLSVVELIPRHTEHVEWIMHESLLIRHALVV